MNEFHLRLGAQVRCLDGLCGKLTKIIIDPPNKQVTDLVITVGPPGKKARIFPLSTVFYTTPDEIHLALTGEQLVNYAEYQESGSVDSVQRQNGRPTMVHKNTRVEIADDFVGRLSQLIIDSRTRAIKHLKIQQGHLFPQFLKVPATFVATLNHHKVSLSLPSRALENFRLSPDHYIH